MRQKQERTVCLYPTGLVGSSPVTMVLSPRRPEFFRIKRKNTFGQ